MQNRETSKYEHASSRRNEDSPVVSRLSQLIEGVTNKRNRMATWLIYLSNVEQSDATVFPVVDDHLKPKRRSAAFQYNVYA
ncbi:unnamed protein product [Adineta steineri]|uniref:Uncharacterized protein n=1 Tax=Adineta steineri TaxID=433720 RepID=A0A819VDE2_9BILA|nr:unnamed protein product [Adineta steineri]CAF4091783.1 unnamed protein product [Adineta steineri]CAF4107418.1 unnamed protein product [Adineta steineri]